MNTIMELAKVHPDNMSTVSPISSLKDLSFNVAARDRKMGSCFFAATLRTELRSLMKNIGAIPKSTNTSPVRGPMKRAP